MRGRFFFAAIGVSAAMVGFAGTSFCQSVAEMASRRDMIDQAQRATVEGDHALALDLGLRAQRIANSPSLREFLAGQHNALGHFAEALGEAELCAREVAAAPTMQNRELIRAACSAQGDLARRHVARIVARPDAPTTDGLRVAVSGHVISDALYGMPYFVNPGTVVIEATAPGFEPFRQEVQAVSGAAIDVPIALHMTHTSTSVPTSPNAATTHGPRETRTAGVRIGPVVTTSVGAAGIIAGAVFGVLYFASVGDLDAHCALRVTDNRYQCDPQAAAIRARAETFGTTSLIALGAGVAITAAGILWWMVRPSAEQPRAAWGVMPSSGGATVVFGGSL